MNTPLDTLPMVGTFPATVRIRFDKVVVDFPTASGPMRVIDGVSLDVHQGEFVSIIGPSGCGKTTLMNIVGGFVKPTRGQVLLDHEPVKGPGPDRGVIFQEYGVFPWLTVRANIEFGLGLRRRTGPNVDPRDEHRSVDVVRWRGDRETGRAWPLSLYADPRAPFPWVPEHIEPGAWHRPPAF